MRTKEIFLKMTDVICDAVFINHSFALILTVMDWNATFSTAKINLKIKILF